MLESMFGANQPAIATTLITLGLSQRQQGRYNEAEATYIRAATMLKGLFGADHPDLAAAEFNLACLYVAQERYIESEPHFQEAVRIYEVSVGENHPNVGRVLLGYVQMLRAAGRDNDANPLADRAEKILGSAS